MGLLVLGCPRSGTNFITHLLHRALGGTSYNEPFSMNLEWVLRHDLVLARERKDHLRCRCGGCFVCRLRSHSSSRDFIVKETSLFEYLPTLVDEFPITAALYLERDVEAIAASYCRNKLGERWALDGRDFAAHVRARPVLSQRWVEEYATRASLAKRDHWRSWEPSIPTLTVSYDELVTTPGRVLEKVCELTGRCVADSRLAEVAGTAQVRAPEATGTYATF